MFGRNTVDGWGLGSLQLFGCDVTLVINCTIVLVGLDMKPWWKVPKS